MFSLSLSLSFLFSQVTHYKYIEHAVSFPPLLLEIEFDLSWQRDKSEELANDFLETKNIRVRIIVD